jgi:hypothetical protein
MGVSLADSRLAAWSAKCSMNMRPLYQPQIVQTEAAPVMCEIADTNAFLPGRAKLATKPNLTDCRPMRSYLHLSIVRFHRCNRHARKYHVADVYWVPEAM